jgi:hypothetical protein
MRKKQSTAGWRVCWAVVEAQIGSLVMVRLKLQNETSNNAPKFKFENDEAHGPQKRKIRTKEMEEEMCKLRGRAYLHHHSISRMYYQNQDAAGDLG